MTGHLRISLAIGAAMLLPLEAGFARVAVIKIATGTVSIQRGAKLLPAAIGMKLEAGDSIVTGANGRVGLTFDDSSRFAIGPGSRVVLSDFQFNATSGRGQFLTRVDRGKLIVVSGRIARSDKNAMRVRTPTSLLGVIGTKFLVVVE